MFSRGLSVAIPTVAAPTKYCFRRNHLLAIHMRIPYGNHAHDAYFSVGITAFNPRLQVRSSLPGMHTIICTHASQTRRAQRGRASTRPYTACIYHPDNALAITTIPHRVAVGATGRSPETHAHCGHGGRNAGELPLAPTLQVYTANNNL